MPVQIVPAQALGVRKPASRPKAEKPAPPKPEPAAEEPPAPEPPKPEPKPRQAERPEPKPVRRGRAGAPRQAGQETREAEAGRSREPPDRRRPATGKAGRPASRRLRGGTGNNPPAPRPGGTNGEAGRRGGSRRHSLGTSAFGSQIAGLDNPDFKFGYYIDQLLAAIDSKWVRPPLGNEVKATISFRIQRTAAHRARGRPVLGLQFLRSRGAARGPERVPLSAPAAGVPPRLPGSQPDRPLTDRSDMKPRFAISDRSCFVPAPRRAGALAAQQRPRRSRRQSCSPAQPAGEPGHAGARPRRAVRKIKLAFPAFRSLGQLTGAAAARSHELEADGAARPRRLRLLRDPGSGRALRAARSPATCRRTSRPTARPATRCCCSATCGPRGTSWSSRGGCSTSAAARRCSPSATAAPSRSAGGWPTPSPTR